MNDFFVDTVCKCFLGIQREVQSQLYLAGIGAFVFALFKNAIDPRPKRLSKE